MVKIILDIFLILLFIGVGALQCLVLYRIKELKVQYKDYQDSQNKFSRSIEQARQSLMMLSSQSETALPELKRRVEESQALLQDFSFVIARANKKIDLLEELSGTSESERNAIAKNSEIKEKPSFNVQLNNIHATHKAEKVQQENEVVESDPLLSRLEKMERQEQTEIKEIFKNRPTITSAQQEMIDKALKEIL